MWDGLHFARDAARAYDIASILVRHGSGDLVRRSGLDAALHRVRAPPPNSRYANCPTSRVNACRQRTLEDWLAEVGPPGCSQGLAIALHH